MSEEELIRLNWYFYSLKEQFKFVNRTVKNIEYNGYYDLNKESISFYKKSLVLFKKSFDIFNEFYKYGYLDQQAIYKIKEIYLRRTLVNLKSAINSTERILRLYVHNQIFEDYILKLDNLYKGIIMLASNLK